MPTAKVGAPPARDRIETSPTSCANWLSASGAMANPQPEMAAEAEAALVPIRPAGAFIAKYAPGCSTLAAISAMMATKLSASMAP